jgi:triosephosphate isomerase
MARRKFIAGNWKMNTTAAEAVELAKGVVAAVGSVTDVDIAVCPPYPNLAAVCDIVRDSNVKLGAQDVHWEEKGAYTGKVSCAMLKALGVEYVIIGHSEQRAMFGETDEMVNRKVRAALRSGLKPIVCVGETLEERNGGQMEDVVERQVRDAFAGIEVTDAFNCTIAYEPVWAIGTGVNATPAQANEAHVFIRGILADMYSEDLAQTITIQYGGSMKPENAKELLSQDDVDGGLIGGASLKPADFAGIVVPR